MQVKNTRLSATRLLAHDFITRRWLVLGLLVLLTGLFWANDGSQYTKFYYALVAAPALLGLMALPSQFGTLRREPVLLTFLVLVAWLLTSLLWTRADDDFSSLGKRPLYVFMMFVACALVAIKSLPLLLQTLRIGAGLGALLALLNVIWFWQSATPGERLIGSGALHNPLLTSHVLGFFCTYWIAAWLSRSEQHDWLPVLMALPLLAALLATGSRTPLMALTLTSIWMLLMSGRRAVYLVGTLLIGAVTIILVAPEIVLQRGTSYRLELWSDALTYASQHLWLGAGYESKFEYKIPGIEEILTDPHNVELAVLLELGLIGLIIWTIMYGFALIRCLKLRNHAPFQIASALLVYGLCGGLTEGGNFLSRPNESWFLIWIPLALMCALSIQHRESRQ